MTAQVVAALLGAAGGIVSSLVVSLTARKKTAAEAEKAKRNLKITERDAPASLRPAAGLELGGGNSPPGET